MTTLYSTWSTWHVGRPAIRVYCGESRGEAIRRAHGALGAVVVRRTFSPEGEHAMCVCEHGIRAPTPVLPTTVRVADEAADRDGAARVA